MQRRVKEADRHRIAFHRLIQLLEIALLQRQDLRERFLSLLCRVGADHLSERIDPVPFKEHVLRTAQPDALRAELARLPCIRRRVRVRTHL